MDDVDRAQAHIEQELALAIQAARGVPGTRYQPQRSHCPDCAELLEAHRRMFGICRHCQELREARGWLYR